MKDFGRDIRSAAVDTTKLFNDSITYAPPPIVPEAGRRPDPRSVIFGFVLALVLVRLARLWRRHHPL